MAESEEELKSLLMKVKERSETKAMSLLLQTFAWRRLLDHWGFPEGQRQRLNSEKLKPLELTVQCTNQYNDVLALHI